MLSHELTELIGKTVETSLFEIDRESIRRFADAIGDKNPLYSDEHYAKNSEFGSIVAPPGFLSSLWFAGRLPDGHGSSGRPSESLGPPVLMSALEKSGFTTIVDTGIDYEFARVARAGDTIKSATVLKDVMERSAKEGKVAFVVTETTYENHEGTIVARARSMTVHQHSAGAV